MLENQMESDKMIEIREADFPELPEIAALEREIFPDAWSLKSLEETWKQKNAAIFVAKTKEGIKIGSKEKTMKKKYGRARDNFGVYTYKKGKMGITFTVDDGKVSAIQYVAY